MRRLDKAEVLSRLDKVAWWAGQGLVMKGPGSSGRIKAHCPKHEDSSPSASLDPVSGYVRCFSSCGEGWGPIDWLVKVKGLSFFEALQQLDGGGSAAASVDGGPRPPQFIQTPQRPRVALPEEPAGVHDDVELLALAQKEYNQQLRESEEGRAYLASRGIPIELALALGMGFVESTSQDDWNIWKSRRLPRGSGCVIFPHTDPAGRVINFFGRATVDPVDGGRWFAHLRRDDRKGCRGLFNALAIRQYTGPLYICEGPFDAASLVAAGYPRTVAMFGTDFSAFTHWLDDVDSVVLALDNDAAGRKSAMALAGSLHLLGKEIEILDPEVYGGHKDMNAAWVAGDLSLPSTPPVPVQAIEEPEERAAMVEVAADSIIPESAGAHDQRSGLDSLANQLEGMLVPNRCGTVEMRLVSKLPDTGKRRWMIGGDLAVRWRPRGEGRPPPGLEGELRDFMKNGASARSAYLSLRAEQMADPEHGPAQAPRYEGRVSDLPLLAPITNCVELTGEEVTRFFEQASHLPEADQMGAMLEYLTRSRASGQYEMLVITNVIAERPEASTWAQVGELAYRWRVREAMEPPRALVGLAEALVRDHIDDVVTHIRSTVGGVATRFFRWQEEGWDRVAGEPRAFAPAIRDDSEPLAATG